MKHILYILLLLLVAASGVYADTNIINVYDANGNLVTGDGRYYEYNDANQLVKVRQGDTIAGPVIAEYFYDFSGQRVKKIENGVVTYYVGKHFEKQVGGANEGNTSYYFGDDSERVAKKDPAGNIFYYHLDHLDGINAVTDSAGTVVAKTDYLPFGEVRAGSSGTEKYSYTGKEKDKTDLYYFEARYNSPEFKHFTQADIAEPDYDDPQDLNRYSYVGNNPLSYVDPDGFKKKKKAKLSKREKWMIAHGSDPDKDKTSLKTAKKLLKAEKKYMTASAASYAPASSSKYSLAGVGNVQGNIDASAIQTVTDPEQHHLSDKMKNALRQQMFYQQQEAAAYGNYADTILKNQKRVFWGSVGAIATAGSFFVVPLVGTSAILAATGRTLAKGAIDIWDAYIDTDESNLVNNASDILSLGKTLVDVLP
jgi:RHS repeat-associated protein